MSTRTSFLCVSFGVLLFTTVPELLSIPPADAPSPKQEFAPLPQTCALPQEQSAADTATVERLSKAYTPASSRPPASIAPPVEMDTSTLWLARAIYSETKLPHEQELVAWVVRNRVETHYRGKSTYREVVLDPYQFSAFNPDSPKRSFLMRLGPETPLAGWQQALWVAYYVRHAEPVYRPFSVKTRHFYSERSMKKHRAPYWAEGSRFVLPEAQRYQYIVDEHRFRFFKQIS